MNSFVCQSVCQLRSINFQVQAKAFLYLCVDKQEHNRFVFQSSLHHHFLHVFAPFRNAVIFRKLNLETLILSSVERQERWDKVKVMHTPHHTKPYHTTPHHTIPYHTIPNNTAPHIVLTYEQQVESSFAFHFHQHPTATHSPMAV